MEKPTQEKTSCEGVNGHGATSLMDSTRKVHNFFSSNKEAHDKGCGPNSHCFEFTNPNVKQKTILKVFPTFGISPFHKFLASIHSTHRLSKAKTFTTSSDYIELYVII